MPRDYAVFLRGISNVPMAPMRAALEGLGLSRVGSFGASGNFLLDANVPDAGFLEALIGDALGTDAFVRSRDQLEEIVERDPFAGKPGASVFLARHPIEPTLVDALLDGAFDGDPPQVVGRAVYFVHPTRRPGRKSSIDFERELQVRGTMRSSRVVARVLELM